MHDVDILAKYTWSRNIAEILGHLRSVFQQLSSKDAADKELLMCILEAENSIWRVHLSEALRLGIVHLPDDADEIT